ncbi:GGDEF domain-containing protein [Aeromicrobium sp. CnD17-E]|uniref:GGDEF domain-containing protein n=1 Tax=Aeromicrobium sp. CnD17-E TaxID=2954487 RepID=UPI002097FDED|nr:GGDEF domain-containing protein [Aeromicrobium sp. CnD17-E]MCO7239431.1 GGDEF domain-containing protein [Aeromicrobium sp. CnD17-E]
MRTPDGRSGTARGPAERPPWRRPGAWDLRVWHVCGAVAVFVESVVLAVTTATSTPSGSPTPVALLVAPPLAALVLMVCLRSGCWRRRSTLLLWPAAVCVVYGLVGVDAPAAARLVPGLISMAFVFAGLTQPPWRSLWLMVPAVPAFVVAWGGLEGSVLQRTAATAVMWVIVSELPARLITHLHEQRAELERLARTDPLTGVLNRRDLVCRLDTSSGRSTVSVIDVDGFKRFNDTHGHLAGDDLLRRLGGLLSTSLAGVGDVFRTGGDEFVVVLDEEESSARQRLEEVRRRWAAGEQVTLSIGIAPGGPEALRHADLDMYGDKRLRRAAEQVTETPPGSPHGRSTVDPSEAEGAPG